MIAAVATVLNEEQIIGLTIEHLLAHGVDRVYVAHGPSTDGTLRVLRSFDLDVVVVEDSSPVHHQPRWINDLAFLAHTEGFEWIIPFDADEFWCPCQSVTIAEALSGLPGEVVAVRVPQYGYHTLSHRLPYLWPLCKVAYRWQRGTTVTNGNHAVLGLTGAIADDVLVIREWQFQSLEHMREKSTMRVATLDPTLPGTEGTHQRVLAAMSDAELAARWAEMDEEYNVVDPIPVRSR